MLNKTLISIFLFLLFFITSCNKILDEKPNLSLAEPNTLKDLQELLDYAFLMNRSSSSGGEGATDNLYFPDEILQQKHDDQILAYTWRPFYSTNGDWDFIYKTIYVANLALEEVSKIQVKSDNHEGWNNIYGSALFYRAVSYLGGIFTYCKGFDSTTASSELGMPLRLASDFNIHVDRSSLKESYEQVIKDLLQAVPYLPVNPISNFRPSRASAYGLLARTYLSMRNYNKCLLYSDSCLTLKNDLLDYNTLDVSQLMQFTYDNPEIIFNLGIGSFGPISAAVTDTRVDTTLYSSYGKNDLRKEAFFYPFDPGYIFKGSYSGDFSYNFTGIAVDEIYLMRAECLARAGKVKEAMNDLNTLLLKRWVSGTYEAISASTKEEALKIILAERRKELLYRGLRWMDLKRFNLEGRNITLTRKVDGKIYELKPNDPFYALPIPSYVVENFGYKQNEY